MGSGWEGFAHAASIMHKAPTARNVLAVFRLAEPAATEITILSITTMGLPYDNAMGRTTIRTI